MKPGASLSDLSPRQQQVARLIASGLRGKEIQTAMGIQPYTLRAHVRAIYKRTGIKGRVNLARWVQAHCESPRDRIFEAFLELKPAERERTIQDLVEIHQRKGDS